MPASRKLHAATAGVFAFCLLVYAPTLYPTVPGGDAGELIAVANALGVVHPPGYPLWTLLAKLFTLIPFGSIAWRVAWLSAACSAAAAALIFACVRDAVAGDRRDGVEPGSSAAAGGVVAAALFAFSPTVWSYAVGAEVFPLHCLFVALLCRLALAWERSRDPRVATAIAFTIGLGLANHHTLILHATPLAAWMLWTGRDRLFTAGRVATLLGAGLVGLSPYLYLWIAGRLDGSLSWGDTATLQGLLDHLLRRDYGTFQLLPDGHGASSSLAAKVAAYGEHIARATLGLAIVLAPLAIVGSRRATSPRRTTLSNWTLLLAGCALTHLAVFHWRANVPVHNPLLLGVLSRFWMQADVIVCILTGIGFALLARRVVPKGPALVWTVAVALVVLRIGASGGERTARGEGLVERYGLAIVEPLPAGALLLTKGDLITNAVRYLQGCNGVRSDVVVLDQELLTRPWYVRRMAAAHPDVHFPGAFYHPGAAGGFSMRAFLDANRALRPVFVYPDWKEGDTTIEGFYQAWPDGLASQVDAAAAPPVIAAWTMTSAAALSRLDARGWPPLSTQAPGTWERVVLEDVWQARHRRALVLLVEGMKRSDDAGLLTVALGEFEAAARMNPAPPWYLWKNLGIACDRLAAASPALRVRQLEAWRLYLESAPTDDKDHAAIAAAVVQLGKGQQP